MNEYIKKFFDQINAEKINYCHWKSTIRLNRSLEGKTDLDLLVDPSQRAEFENLILNYGFKKIFNSTDCLIESIDNFLGYDKTTGAFFHVHIYYYLFTGKKKYKEYRLPLEKYFWSSNEKYENIRIPAPEFELLIHILRAGIKTTFKNVLRKFARDKIKGFKNTFGHRELLWLIARVDLEKFKKLFNLPELNNLKPDIFWKIVNQKQDVTFRNWLVLKKNSKQFRRKVKAVKVDPHKGRQTKAGGLTVALMGLDGSGKSTVAKEVEEKLNYKLKSRYFYLGSSNNEGQRSSRAGARIERARYYRYFLKFINVQIAERLYDRVVQRVFAQERLRKYQEGLELSKNGFISLFDRFAIAQVSDHPSVAGWGTPGDITGRDKINILTIYEKIKPPDVLILLDIPVARAIERKSARSRKALEDKYQQLQNFFNQPHDSNLIRIDASQALDKVVAEVLNIIWERL